jgi:uncharacterized membrane protein YeaQ/YmgE (transglycosylase-associated protein family)
MVGGGAASGILSMLMVWITVGGIAGWLAGLIVQGNGLGIVGNVILGIVGSAVASFLFPALGITPGQGTVQAVVSAMFGATLVLLLIRLVNRP